MLHRTKVALGVKGILLNPSLVNRSSQHSDFDTAGVGREANVSRCGSWMCGSAGVCREANEKPEGLSADGGASIHMVTHLDVRMSVQ